MKASLLIGGAVGLLVTAFFCAFIVGFDRKKYFSPRLGFYYIVLFFIAGIVMLAISVGH